MKKNNTENFRSFWVKCDNYELIYREDTEYITPTEDSKVYAESIVSFLLYAHELYFTFRALER